MRSRTSLDHVKVKESGGSYYSTYMDVRDPLPCPSEMNLNEVSRTLDHLANYVHMNIQFNTVWNPRSYSTTYNLLVNHS